MNEISNFEFDVNKGEAADLLNRFIETFNENTVSVILLKLIIKSNKLNYFLKEETLLHNLNKILKAYIKQKKEKKNNLSFFLLCFLVVSFCLNLHLAFA